VVRARAGLCGYRSGPLRAYRDVGAGGDLVLAAVANLAAATNWERYAIGPWSSFSLCSRSS
jgi:hypothetical protein